MTLETKKLPSGYEVPVIGLGTWQLTGSTCISAVGQALDLGYRHIDTAYVYGNQREIAEAIRRTQIERSELFITSKIWRDSLTYEKAMKQADEILRQLETDYVDLLLIHWPSEDGVPIEETLSAFGRLVQQGKAHSIGVSNFTVRHLEEALGASEVPLSNNQIRYNPGERPQDVLEFCTTRGISVTAYSPLERGAVLSRRGALAEIASFTGRSQAQIVLRWLLQKGMIVIPKASSRPHLEENLAVLDWELTRGEMNSIGNMT